MLHVFLCAVSWGLSGRVWLRTWCCLEVRVRLNCLCGACSNCNTLGGLLSSVLVVTFLQCFWGVGCYKFSPGSVLFVRAVWLAGVSAQCWGTCCSLWFSAPVCTLVRLLVDVDDGWAHAFCLFTEGFFGVTFYCVYWLLVIDSWGAKRCHARVCCPILCIFVLVVHVLFYGFSGMWLRAHIT